MSTKPETQTPVGGSLTRLVGQQTIGDQIAIMAKARKYSKRHLVAELLESDRILREDARQIFALGEEVKRLRAMLPNAKLCGLRGDEKGTQ